MNGMDKFKMVEFRHQCFLSLLTKIAEEQAGFRAGRSTTEQIFSLRILDEKYLQHQQNLYHVFIDFKKAFDRVWREALWATMREYNINASIIWAIENLYDKAQSAVLFNGSIGEWFRTTVGVWQGCLRSPTLFNIFLERIMCEALDDHEGSVSIGGRLITNFRFADDIVVNAEEEEEAGVLVDRLDTAEVERRIQALEMICYRRLLNISYKDHVMNEEVHNRIQNAIGVHDDLLTMVKKWKLRWYGHISRSSSMAKIILQATVKGIRRGRQKWWEDNIKEWTGMELGDSLRAAEDREGWKGIVATPPVVPRRPPRLRDWGEMRWQKMFWKVTSAVVNMLLCILLFNYDTKPSRKDFCLKYSVLFLFVTWWTVVTIHDIRNGNT